MVDQCRHATGRQLRVVVEDEGKTRTALVDDRLEHLVVVGGEANRYDVGQRPDRRERCVEVWFFGVGNILYDRDRPPDSRARRGKRLEAAQQCPSVVVADDGHRHVDRRRGGWPRLPCRHGCGSSTFAREMFVQSTGLISAEIRFETIPAARNGPAGRPILWERATCVEPDSFRTVSGVGGRCELS